LRHQIIHELKDQSKTFQSSLTAGDEFIGFERHDRLTLLSIASSHRILIDRFTCTKETLKTAIITHFVQGDCCHNINDDQANACINTVGSVVGKSVVENSGDSPIRRETRDRFIYDWLMSQHKNLSRNSLLRLIRILDIEFDSQDDCRALRSHLKKFLTVFKFGPQKINLRIKKLSFRTN
jgi:hypothetical protein